MCKQNCPSGMTDSLATCGKQNYDRGIGTNRTCEAPLEEDALLCYPECEDGYDGIGPVCWKGCPDSSYEVCGLLCLSVGTCSDYIMDTSSKVGASVQTFVEAGNGDPNMEDMVDGLVDVADAFVLPVCGG